MKKILLSIVMTLALGASVFAQNSSEQSAVNAARTAIKQSCDNAQGNLSYAVTENYNCNIFDGTGVNRTISFWRTPVCPGNQICIAVVIPVGTVVVDCDNSIVSVSCGAPVTQ